MRWIDVESANVLRIAYDPETWRLHVVFVAAPALVYEYEGVSAWTFVQLLNAQSVGGEFNRLVRSRPDLHPYKKRKL